MLHLLDLRHDPNESDRLMIDWLQRTGTPFRIVLTKADKLSREAAGKRLQQMAAVLNVDPDELVLFSASNRQGVETLREWITAAVT